MFCEVGGNEVKNVRGKKFRNPTKQTKSENVFFAKFELCGYLLK